MSGIGFAHGVISRVIRMELNIRSRNVGIRKPQRFIRSAKRYKKRSKARGYLRSLGVVRGVGFHRRYVRSGSRKRMWVNGRRWRGGSVNTRVY
jgi:hypothetical protein